MIYSEPCNVRFSDFNRNGVLSYEGIFRAFESVAVHHSDAVDENMFDATREGRAWIITTWRIHVDRFPTYEEAETLTCETWTYAEKPRATSNRFYVIKDGTGNEISQGWAVFARLNIGPQKLLRFTPEILDRYQPELRRLFEGERSVRLRPLPEYTDTLPLQVRRTDIDYNEHVHNISYMNYALEALTEEDFTTDAVRDIRIFFGAQVRYGDDVTLCWTRSADDETNVRHYDIAVKADGLPACLLRLSTGENP